MVSRCPHCKLVYKISSEDLTQAAGAVRCSNCMKIFNALNHKVSTPNSARSEQISDYKKKPEASHTVHTSHNQQTRDDFELSIQDDSYTWHQKPPKAKTKAKTKTRAKQATNMGNNEQNSFNTTAKRHSTFDLYLAKLAFNKKYAYFFIATLAILTIAFMATRFLLQAKLENSGFIIEEIILFPAENLNKFNVKFSIKNLSTNSALLPKLKFEMQDLSQNTIKTQIIDLNRLFNNREFLKSKEKREITVELQRPKKLVAGVKIFLLPDEAK